MFTLSIQLALSLILHANFQHEGIVILIDFVLLQFASLSVLSITYGYRIYIILFQRHKNSTEVFRAKLFDRIDDDLSQKCQFILERVAAVLRISITIKMT